MPTDSPDVAIIGAGTAGLAAERSARRAGARTLLVDEGFSGTTCATVGCMPSKLLIAAGKSAWNARRAGLFGIATGEVSVDGEAVMARLRRERQGFVAGVQAAFDALPPGVRRRGRARFLGPLALEIDDGRALTPRAVVIATGAVPKIPHAFAHLADRVLTNETLFELTALPASVAVVGAGPLGLEMAQALARLGVEVEVFDQGKTLGGLPKGAPAAALRDALAREFPIHLGATLKAEAREGGVALTWDGADRGDKTFERLLLAAGRPAQLAGLGLEKTGLRLDDAGAPRFDPHTLQCGETPIFIAGDAAADRPVLHEASAEGAIAGHNAATWPKVAPVARSTPLAIMFTDPPAAKIGAVPKSGDESVVRGGASYADQGRAKIEARDVGAIDLFAERTTGRLTGAILVGPDADHTAHLIAWAIQEDRTASQLLDMPFYHPTVEEGLKPALRAICQAIHSPRPAERDGFTPGA